MNLREPSIPFCAACDRRASFDGEIYRCPECSAPFGETVLDRASTPVTKEEIVEYAKTLVGIPYVHLGRSEKNGVDCVGMLRLVANRFGISSHDFFNYAPTADGASLIRELDTAFGVDDGYDPGLPFVGTYESGDVLAFWVRKRTKPTHAGIFVRLDDGRPGMIHTYANIKKVTIHGLNKWWLDRICKVYRWPEVE